MSRISDTFRSAKRPLIIAFTVAGDPDPETSVKIAESLVVSGADILELGVPFSDPVADGPVIQRAGIRALAAGTNPDRVFEMVMNIRRNSDVPIVLLTYYNSVYRRGIRKFYQDAKYAGVDGLLVADMPVEESDDVVAAAQDAGIDQIFMVSETTSLDRLEKIIGRAGGFLYLVSRLGVTGIRKNLPAGIDTLISKVRKQTAMPIAVGFGISSPEHVRFISSAGADAVIVGSVIVGSIEDHIGDFQEMQDEISECVSSMRDATIPQNGY